LLSELDGKAFISNSDAHSLPKIGREYNVFTLEEPNFNEILKALKGINQRRVKANYGLDPRLGKYHRSYCLVCEQVIEGEPPVSKCPVSQKHSVIIGVRDRLEIIKDRSNPEIKNRPPYKYQIPLEFLPKIGSKTIDKLVNNFGTEMKILHELSLEDLLSPGIIKEEAAQYIILARDGKLGVGAGGGGVYGSIIS
jgi:uncharacterized protein (TIGR00375 family)